jgi:hypothetical protein
MTFCAVIDVIAICGAFVWATAPAHIATGISKNAGTGIEFLM